GWLGSPGLGLILKTNTDAMVFQLDAIGTYLQRGLSGGRAITPLSGTATSGVTVNAELTVAPVFNLNGETLDVLTVRDTIMPEITDMLDTGIRGFREKWTKIFSDSFQGLSTTVPVTG